MRSVFQILLSWLLLGRCRIVFTPAGGGWSRWKAAYSVWETSKILTCVCKCFWKSQHWELETFDYLLNLASWEGSSPTIEQLCSVLFLRLPHNYCVASTFDLTSPNFIFFPIKWGQQANVTDTSAMLKKNVSYSAAGSLSPAPSLPCLCLHVMVLVPHCH